MRLDISPRTRQVVYVITAVGTPLVAYLSLRGFIGPNEVALWAAEVSVVSIMAGLNVDHGDAEQRKA